MDLEPSIPICCALAATGGTLEVFATAVLAYPASRSLEGVAWTHRQLKGCLALNIILQIFASIAGNLLATWFGPVAIVGPIFFAAQLLANLVVFWIVLGLEAFSREMQIGTYVIVVAVVMLIVNGPGSQDYGDRTFQDLITQIYAISWGCVLMGAMFITGVFIMAVDLHEKTKWFTYTVLLVARTSAFSLNLSTGKALILPTNRFWLGANIFVKIVSGIIYTKAIVVQSTAVEQKIFVPMNAAMIVLINGLTGIIIWEDWRVVSSWVGYLCVFLLLALGCGLLLGDLRLLQETSPQALMGARWSMVYKSTREEMLKNLRNFGQIDWDEVEKAKQATLSHDEHHHVSMDEFPDHSNGFNPLKSSICSENKQHAANSDEEMHLPTAISSAIPVQGNRRRCASEGLAHADVTPGMPEVPSHRHARSDLPMAALQSRRPGGALRSQSCTLMSKPKNHREAWMAVYQASGVLSKRSSKHLHKVVTDDPETDEENEGEQFLPVYTANGNGESIEAHPLQRGRDRRSLHSLDSSSQRSMEDVLESDDEDRSSSNFADDA